MLRNVLVHDYFRIDVNEVWRTVEIDLPVLKENLIGIAEGEAMPKKPPAKEKKRPKNPAAQAARKAKKAEKKKGGPGPSV